MPHFPVSSSILSKTHLARFIHETYSLGPSTTCQLLKAGVNHSYLITDGTTKYVFRVYSLNWRTETEIQEEIRLLQHLQAGGVPVSYPLPDAEGNYLQTILAPEGKRLAVLFSFAEGEKLLTFPAELHYTIGQIMARFHLLTQNLHLNRVTYTPQLMLVDSLEKAKPFLPADAPEIQFLLDLQQQLLREFDTIDTQAVRWGVVHLDIWFDNLNIAHDGTITLFDFDFCGNAMQCFDIGYYIITLHDET